jgi:hypothetical protein
MLGNKLSGDSFGHIVSFINKKETLDNLLLLNNLHYNYLCNNDYYYCNIIWTIKMKNRFKVNLNNKYIQLLILSSFFGNINYAEEKKKRLRKKMRSRKKRKKKKIVKKNNNLKYYVDNNDILEISDKSDESDFFENNNSKKKVFKKGQASLLYSVDVDSSDEEDFINEINEYREKNKKFIPIDVFDVNSDNGKINVFYENKRKLEIFDKKNNITVYGKINFDRKRNPSRFQYLIDSVKYKYSIVNHNELIDIGNMYNKIIFYEILKGNMWFHKNYIFDYTRRIDKVQFTSILKNFTTINFNNNICIGKKILIKNCKCDYCYFVKKNRFCRDTDLNDKNRYILHWILKGLKFEILHKYIKFYFTEKFYNKIVPFVGLYNNISYFVDFKNNKPSKKIIYSQILGEPSLYNNNIMNFISKDYKDIYRKYINDNPHVRYRGKKFIHLNMDDNFPYANNKTNHFLYHDLYYNKVQIDWNNSIINPTDVAKKYRYDNNININMYELIPKHNKVIMNTSPKKITLDHELNNIFRNYPNKLNKNKYYTNLSYAICGSYVTKLFIENVENYKEEYKNADIDVMIYLESVQNDNINAEINHNKNYYKNNIYAFTKYIEFLGKYKDCEIKKIKDERYSMVWKNQVYDVFLVMAPISQSINKFHMSPVKAYIKYDIFNKKWLLFSFRTFDLFILKKGMIYFSYNYLRGQFYKIEKKIESRLNIKKMVIKMKKRGFSFEVDEKLFQHMKKWVNIDDFTIHKYSRFNYAKIYAHKKNYYYYCYN